jgi:hypothetical protein
MNWKNLALNIRCSFYSHNHLEYDRNPVSFDKAQTIGILLYNNRLQYNDALISFVKELQKNGKKIQILNFKIKTLLICLLITSISDIMILTGKAILPMKLSTSL